MGSPLRLPRLTAGVLTRSARRSEGGAEVGVYAAGVITLTAGSVVVQVNPAIGGRLTSLRVQGHELLVAPTADPLLSGCYPMVPFAGRVRDGRFEWGGDVHQLRRNHASHAMHGTGFDRAWLVEQSGPDHLHLRVDLQPHWPFAGWANQHISLTADRLDLRLEVHTDGPSFPATAGWHPWFRRSLATGGDLVVAMDATGWYPRDDQGLPLGPVAPPPPAGPWDDCFTGLTWPATLTWPGALVVSITSTGDHLVLYDHPAHAICVEPQTGPPDALNHPGWPQIVHPTQPLITQMSLAWSPP